MKRKIKCKWCHESHFKKQIHICPKIFIHKLENKEIIIRGNNLDIKWIGNAILIEEDSVNGS